MKRDGESSTVKNGAMYPDECEVGRRLDDMKGQCTGSAKLIHTFTKRKMGLSGATNHTVQLSRVSCGSMGAGCQVLSYRDNPQGQARLLTNRQKQLLLPTGEEAVQEVNIWPAPGRGKEPWGQK